MSLNEKNNPIILNSGSITNPDNRHSLQFYSQQVREDLLKIENYINNVSVQIFKTLTDSSTYNEDAVINGLSGKTIKTTLETETVDDLETVYWDPNLNRSKTIYESIAFLTAKLNDVSEIVSTDVETPELSGLTNTISELRNILNTIKKTLNEDVTQDDYTISVTVNNTAYTNIHEALRALSARLEELIDANGATELGLLDDVTLLDTINNNDVLYHDGTNWVNGKISVADLQDGGDLLRDGDDVSLLNNSADYTTITDVDIHLGERGATTVNNIGQDLQRNIALSGSNIESTHNEINYTSANGNDIDAHLEGIDTKLGELSNSSSTLLMENIVAGDRLQGNGPKVLNLVQANENFSIKKVFLDISGDVISDGLNTPDGSGHHRLTLQLGEVVENTCVEFYPYTSVITQEELNIKYLVKPISAPTNSTKVYFSYTGITQNFDLDLYEGDQAATGVEFRGRISKITINVVNSDLIFVTIDIPYGHTLYV